MPTLPEYFGAEPARILWKIVRGDSSSIRIDFLENDESTGFDCSGWSYASVAYNPKTDTEYDLDVDYEGHSVIISIPPQTSMLWGRIYGTVVAELLFDLQVDTGTEVWTPIVGSIIVIGDVGGSL